MTETTPDSSSLNAKGKREAIKGLVADILNEREVVLNLGKRNGVEIGMRFAILEEHEYEIIDPETREVLGNLPPREKIRVEIVELEEKLSIARTYQTYPENVGGTGFAGLGYRDTMEDILRGIAGPPRIVKRPYTFRIGEGGVTYFKKISPEQSVVRIGDAVRQISDENDEDESAE
jgi:hypothetical protein